MVYRTRLIFILIFTLLLSLSTFAQTQNRVIYFSDKTIEFDEQSAGDDEAPSLELIYIQIAGNQITSGKQFAADENWLKNLKIRVKNVSSKPIAYLELVFGLLEDIDEELEPSASWRFAFGFQCGKPIENKAKVKTKDEILLQPNEEVELTYESMNELTKSTFAKTGEGTFHKAQFRIARVQFETGEEKDSYLFIRKK